MLSHPIVCYERWELGYTIVIKESFYERQVSASWASLATTCTNVRESNPGSEDFFFSLSGLMKPVSPQAAQLAIIFVDNKNKEPDLGHSMTFIVTES